MWYTILITLVVDIGGLLLIYAVLSDRVRRVTTTTSQIAALRDEVSRLVVELNQTTERNVALMEDRIASLNEACAAADKKMGLLRREIERHDVGAQIYSRLAEERRPVPPAGRAAAQPAGAERAPQGTSPGARSAAARDREGPGAEQVPRSVADGMPAAGPGGDGVSGAEDTQDVRQRIMMLHRSGFPASLIASRVGMPLGEVELIISLESRKGQG